MKDTEKTTQLLRTDFKPFDFHTILVSITKLLEKINYVKKTKKIPSSS